MDSANTQPSTSLVARNHTSSLKRTFKENKLTISSAIKKNFPFLETLRDRELITDDFYEKLQYCLKIDGSVFHVVYEALNQLEKKFDQTHLNILFNEIHLKEYPELYHIHEEFTKVIQNIEYMQDGHGADPLEGPAGLLSLEPGTGENVEEDLTSGPGNAAIANEIRSDDLTDTSSGEENREVSIRARKRSRDATGLRKPSECRKHHRKRVRRLLSSSESSGDEAPQRDDDMVGVRRVLSFSDSSGDEAPQRDDDMDGVRRVLSSSESSGDEAPQRDDDMVAGPRIRKDRNMNFDVPELPVTCGKAKGTLYKEKLMQGSASKCILSENGEAWLTLREFEIEGGKERCKNWRLSVRCGGWTLKELIKKELLPNPPRTKRRKLMRMPPDSTLYDPCPNNYNVCVVCNRSGTLYCCDSCPRSFHMSCHIQHIDPKRDPWYCIFCSVMTIMENPSQNQYYQESEVLVRPMDYINDLKCKLVLLKIYSNPKSPFFSQEPYHGRDHLPGDPRSMCLNRVKDKLRRKKYTQVGAFVRDMRLIFENHKTFYKSRSIIMLGFQLEKEFDTNFKEIFRIK